MATPQLSPLLGAGAQLRARRLELGLTLRDVRLASLKIAADRRNKEFAISIGRLSTVERDLAVPGIYRLHSLAQIYRLDLTELLGWFGAGNEPLR